MYLSVSIRAICNCATVFSSFPPCTPYTRLLTDSIIYIIYILATEFNAFLSLSPARQSLFSATFIIPVCILREEFIFFVARFSLAIILHHRWCPTTHPNCPYLLLLLRFRSVLFPILMVNLLGLHFFLYITLPTHAEQPLKFGCLYDIFSITRFDFLIFHL